MIEVRSYRRVFDLERRIYSVDRLRLNPAGVPVRGVIYLLVSIFVAVILSGLPLIGDGARTIPWYMRDLVLPGGVAAVLSVVRIDGRPFHLAARALLRLWLQPRRVASLQGASRPVQRWSPPDLVFLPDGSDSRLRRIRYTGPGAVLVLVEHRRGGEPERTGAGITARRAEITLHPGGQGRALHRGQVISLAEFTRLLVRSAPVSSRR